MKQTNNYMPNYMTVHQVAEYLQLNEKKIYALVNDHSLPATKVTGKWMFPRELIDQWMTESSHGGLLLDRLTIAGPDDSLLMDCIERVSKRNQSHALVAYVNGNTRSNLDLLAAGRIDVAILHWGPESESQIRHPALLELHGQQHSWVLVGGIKRELGIGFNKTWGLKTSLNIDDLQNPNLTWAKRSNHDGVWRFFQDAAVNAGLDVTALNTQCETSTERQTAAAVASGRAQLAPMARSTANEFGLGFQSLGWERIDFAMARAIWFRSLFQIVMEEMTNKISGQLADQLGGYDFVSCGKLVWGDR